MMESLMFYYVQMQVVINLKEVEVVWCLVYAWELIIKDYPI